MTTKQLARELGILRERKLSCATYDEKNKREKSCQKFSYLVVIDFESTCWKGDKTKTQEIIEFPAVLLNTCTGQIGDEFHYYVQPQEHPTLSDFCRQLTGISQNQVDNGIPLPLCLRKFSHWLNKLFQDKKICLTGDNVNGHIKTSLHPAAFVTWSDWDLGVCLHYELRRKQILKAPCFNQWIDLRATYTKFYGRKPKGLNGALQDVGIEFEGREHSGLHDSRNTAILAWRMIRDGCIMNITKSLNATSYSHVNSLRAQEPVSNKKYIPKKSSPNRSLKSQKEMLKGNNGSSSRVNSPLVQEPVSDKRHTPPKISPKDSVKSQKEVPREDKSSVSGGKENGKSGNANMLYRGLRLRNPNIPHLSQNEDGYKNISHLSQKRAAVFTPEKCSSSKCPKLSTPTRDCTWKNPRNKNLAESLSLEESAASKIFHPETVSVKLSQFTLVNQQVNTCSKSVVQPSSAAKAPSDTLFKKPFPASASNDSVYSCLKGECKKSSYPVLGMQLNKTKQNTNGIATCLVQPRAEAPPVDSNPSFSSEPCKLQKWVGQSCPLSAQHNFTNKPLLQTDNSLHIPVSSEAYFKSYSNANLSRTPQTLPRASSSTMKKTPPLCSCGRRARRRMVQSPGPNMGRWFFSCVKGSANSANCKISGCKFFQWEASFSTFPVKRGTRNGISAQTQSTNASFPVTPVLRMPGFKSCPRRLGVSGYKATLPR